jgi:hypothetical protein
MGAVLPMLEILNKHAISISYINSSAGDGFYQDFNRGLLIENPLIDEIRRRKTWFPSANLRTPLTAIRSNSFKEKNE